jgi:hypothetical protein
MSYWQEFKYKNITYVLIGLLIAIVLSNWQPFIDLLSLLKYLHFIGAFIGGILFVSTFTFGIGTVILTNVTQTMHPIAVAIFAGLGAVVGDLIIFRFVKDRLLKEIKPLYEKISGTHLTRVLNSHYFAWMLPFLGALIIASPLPDEIGVSLMGLSEISTKNFVILSFFLNTFGIFLILVGYLAFR